jgi:hypothetical protein
MPQETDEPARTFSNQCRVAHKLMHECNGVAKFARIAWPARPLCLSSQPPPFIMPATYRSVGANEGQMRKLIGYPVARNGAGNAVVRVADDIFLSDLVLTGSVLTDSVLAGSPIAIAYSGENFARAAIADTAGVPAFGVSDCGIRAGQAASEDARRN